MASTYHPALVIRSKEGSWVPAAHLSREQRDTLFPEDTARHSPYGTRKDPDPLPEKEKDHTERKPGRVPVVAYTRESPDDGDSKTPTHRVDVVQHTRRFPPHGVGDEVGAPPEEDPPLPTGALDLDSEYVGTDERGYSVFRSPNGDLFALSPERLTEAIERMRGLRIDQLLGQMKQADAGFEVRFLWGAMKLSPDVPIQTQINAWRLLHPSSVQAGEEFVAPEGEMANWKHYAPGDIADSATFMVDGVAKTLDAFANVNAEGKYDSDGDSQCTELIGRYLETVLGIPPRNPEYDTEHYVERMGMLHGQYEADTVGNRYPDRFEVEKNGGARSPTVGAIVSTEGSGVDEHRQPTGHVAIIKSMEAYETDDKGNPTILIASLIEQNIGKSTSGEVASDRIIYFVYANGGWVGAGNYMRKDVDDSSMDYPVVAWANPK